MRALAIDTSTEVLALSAVNGPATFSLALRKGLQHSPALAPLMQRLLSEIGLSVRDLQLIVCSIGPGSFTGIRIGLATAMGISFATGCPMVGISTLDMLASPHENHDGDVFAVIDARKGNIYTAAFRAGRRRGDYLDIPPRELREKLAAAERPFLAGPDAGKIRDLLLAVPAPGGKEAEGRLSPDALPFSCLLDPLALLRLGEAKFARHGADTEEGLRPLYLRKSEAEIAGGL